MTAPVVKPVVCTPEPIGASGFSLVFKGCSSSNQAEYYDKTECVRDNTTGLIWQTHAAWNASSLRAAGQKFTHYTSTTLAQKVNTDTANPTPIMLTPSQADIDAATNLMGFQRQVNAARLCGNSAWRSPTTAELKGLSASSALHAEWLPNSRGRTYWSSTVAVPASFSYFDIVDISSGTVFGTYGLGSRPAEITENVILVHN
ncbi:MAG: DUF1566 domain-containing protein [Uliginosibacterium sp.]|nr:DUF1566 domain-containing protein [Uliginosibacterium sp.]